MFNGSYLGRAEIKVNTSVVVSKNGLKWQWSEQCEEEKMMDGEWHTWQQAEKASCSRRSGFLETDFGDVYCSNTTGSQTTSKSDP